MENSVYKRVEKLVSVYKDKRLWDMLSKNGLAFAEKNWGQIKATITSHPF
jgi:hypothetical protein